MTLLLELYEKRGEIRMIKFQCSGRDCTNLEEKFFELFDTEIVVKLC